MPWAPQRLGSRRIENAYAWKRFHALGVPVPFGSDFPVEGVDPCLGLFAAVTTATGPGKPALRPDQQLDLATALRGFTRDAAFASFAEASLGTIEAGKVADLTVFDRDLLALPPEAILEARVRMTIVAGKVCHESVQ
jgi:predicted amidohydrolase YtcJ